MRGCTIAAAGRAIVACFVAWFLAAFLVTGSINAQSPDDNSALLEHVNEPWTGDLDGMVERGFVRLLTAHNPLYHTYDGIDQKGPLMRGKNKNMTSISGTACSSMRPVSLRFCFRGRTSPDLLTASRPAVITHTLTSR